MSKYQNFLQDRNSDFQSALVTSLFLCLKLTVLTGRAYWAMQGFLKLYNVNVSLDDIKYYQLHFLDGHDLT